MPKTLRLILGDQLNGLHSWFQKVDDQVLYLMMEMRQETDYVSHHFQKIVGFFLAMRNFSEELKQAGHQVLYFKLDDPDNRQNLKAQLDFLIEKEKITQIALKSILSYLVQVQDLKLVLF